MEHGTGCAPTSFHIALAPALQLSRAGMTALPTRSARAIRKTFSRTRIRPRVTSAAGAAIAVRNNASDGRHDRANRDRRARRTARAVGVHADARGEMEMAPDRARRD